MIENNWIVKNPARACPKAYHLKRSLFGPAPEYRNSLAVGQEWTSGYRDQWGPPTDYLHEVLLFEGAISNWRFQMLGNFDCEMDHYDEG